MAKAFARAELRSLDYILHLSAFWGKKEGNTDLERATTVQNWDRRVRSFGAQARRHERPCAPLTEPAGVDALTFS